MIEKYLSETTANKHSPYFDAALEAVELRRERHATNQQCSPHVGEAQHKLFGLSLDLDSQLPGGGQDESHGTPDAVCWILKDGDKQYLKRQLNSNKVCNVFSTDNK